jgi:hypothetical protein
MGYAVAFGPCWSCGVVFGFNPARVPSIVVDGEREALCRSCVDRANELRRASDQPLIDVLPGAYDPAELGEL